MKTRYKNRHPHYFLRIPDVVNMLGLLLATLGLILKTPLLWILASLVFGLLFFIYLVLLLRDFISLRAEQGRNWALCIAKSEMFNRLENLTI